ncbi:conserved hypothetical protein [Leishmania major strain Friedlin]|uniref:Uncharacterized protein n=1 Tax=Leishmania major TaxID=5664 RepID=E9AF67_LEIMA|nr:conserved hypothetical protein [Leishmania major strain Friedlin]CAG9582596.1 hypothetical_protein_-_conserved [Leishmania major strain Friedlin]CBZ12871.1 conserved hypothetical protein [Leishmania major strain Friedlin]|eukprot:XP_003722637.1 conserved hypothetical protein [Leishmania major strain Friedlin]
MPVVSSFVAAVLLGGAPILLDAVSVESRAHEGRNGSTLSSPEQDYSDPVASASKSTALSSSSSGTGSSDTTRPAHSWWQDLCGNRAYGRCFLTYATSIVCVGVLLLAVGSWCLRRWWRYCTRWLSRWRRFVDDASDAENDSAVRSGDAVVSRRGLLSGHQLDSQDVPDDERAGRRAAESDRALGTFFHADSCIVEGARLWGARRQTPVGLFYMSTQPTDSTEERRRTDSIAVDAGEGATDNPRDSRNLSRDADRTPSASPRASASLSHMQEVLCLATAITDSSDTGDDRGDHRGVSSCESSMRDRRCSCESDRGGEAHAEVERPALRGAAADERGSPLHIRGDILTHLIHFNSSFDAEDQLLTSDCRNNASASQQPRGGLAAMTRSTASDASVESSSHTPPPPAHLAELSRRSSASCVCLFGADAFHDTPCARVALPHVGTAIFDAGMTHHADQTIADGLFDTGCFPPTEPSSEALCTTVESYISEVEYLALPSEHESTAAPSPVPNAALHVPFTSLTKTALPATDALSDRLDMVEEKSMEEGTDGAALSRNCVPTPQLRHLPAAKPPKSLRKRRSERYCEPWQPVLAPCKTLPLAAAAVVTTLSPLSPPSSLLCNRVQRSPGPNALEDDLDDLMLADEVSSAQSNTTGNGSRVFTDSSLITSRALTPSAESEQEMAATPLVMTVAHCSDANVCLDLEPKTPLVSVNNPQPPASPPIAMYPRTAGSARTLMGKSDEGSHGQFAWSPPVDGPRPALNLSVEERTLLLKSKKWLFPLIDGADEIE